MRLEIILLVLGMSFVTYIPRMLPAMLIGKLRIGEKFEKFLKLIPYTAMAALIFPGVITTDAGNPLIGIVGAAVAIILALFKCPVIITVIGAIVADLMLYAII